MAHFAKLDENNIVTNVHVVDNVNLLDSDGKESEAVGIAYLIGVHGGGTWKQTSYNANFRKNYAGIGHKYYLEHDLFAAPQPYASWTLNTTTGKWEAPVAYPSDGKIYNWNEDNKQWVELTL